MIGCSKVQNTRRPRAKCNKKIMPGGSKPSYFSNTPQYLFVKTSKAMAPNNFSLWMCQHPNPIPGQSFDAMPPQIFIYFLWVEQKHINCLKSFPLIEKAYFHDGILTDLRFLLFRHYHKFSPKKIKIVGFSFSHTNLQQKWKTINEFQRKSFTLVHARKKPLGT